MAPIEISCILCHHKGDFIYKAVESIKSSYGITYEIIIVTSDDELALKGIPGCFVVNNYGGPAEKRNVGSRVSKGDYIAFMDDDVEINSDCLLKMLAALKTDSVDMVYGKLYNMERRNRFDEAGGYLTSSGFIWSRAGQNDIDIGQYDSLVQILAGKSALCMLKAEAFYSVGGFDEDFWILGEETDLSWRLRLRGYSVWFLPWAVGYHAFNTRFKPANEYYTSKRVQYNGCRNYITMLIKNLEVYNLWKILPIHILIWFSAGIIMCLTGKFSQGLNILKGLAYVLMNLRSVLIKRINVQEKRVRSDREIWPHIFRRAPRGYYTQRFTRYLKIGLHG